MSQNNTTGDFGDFSLTDDDLYEDFLRREAEYEKSQSDSEKIAEGNKRESDLLGNSDSTQEDELSSIEDEISDNKHNQSHGDIQALMAMVKKDKDYDISDDAANEDMLEAFRRQQATNKHIASSIGDMPLDLHLLDDPVELPEDTSAASAGDDKMFKVGTYLAAALSALAILLVSASIYINTKPEEEVAARPPEVTQGTGDIINSALGEEELTTTVTTTQNADGSTSSDSDSSTSDDTESEDIRYEIVSEGGIRTASISYINASGSRESETGVTLPWKKTVRNASSITPHIAANPGERGTLTCKIYRGSEKIAEDTAAGENASVECKAR